MNGAGKNESKSCLFWDTPSTLKHQRGQRAKPQEASVPGGQVTENPN